MKTGCLIALLFGAVFAASSQTTTVRSMRFQERTPEAAVRWQNKTRLTLFELMMAGGKPERVDLKPEILRRIEIRDSNTVLEELTIQSLPDRKVHLWLSAPMNPSSRVGAVLALHGHGGTGEEIVRGQSLYWYGRTLAEMGYVVISPDLGQHELRHGDWTLMGERVWDALRCLDYLETRPEVDAERIAVAGLSLGGETAMYVAALDPRVKTACSSGWLTTVANMKNGHCPCWSFPGLEEHFDFADIFACVAPRPLVLELGEKEHAPGGFPVSIGRGAYEEIREAYRVFKSNRNVTLTVHPGGHVFVGADFWIPLRAALGTPSSRNSNAASAALETASGSGPEKPSKQTELPILSDGRHWKLTWSDEFNGPELDAAKWDVMGDWKRRDGHWVKEDAYLDGKGNLLLRTKKVGERFTSGAIRTLGRFEHAFGYWEVRCRLPEQPGHWPAFWLMSKGVGRVGDEGRDGTEIDIVEVPWRNGKITMNLHWDGYGKNHRSAGTNYISKELMSGFHTFGLLWTPREYVFYTDGIETWRTSAGGVSQAPEYLKLTEEIGSWGGDIKQANLPDYFTVDYVRVYDAVAEIPPH